MLIPGINLGLTASVYSHTDTNCQGQGSIHTTHDTQRHDFRVCSVLKASLFLLLFVRVCMLERSCVYEHTLMPTSGCTHACVCTSVSVCARVSGGPLRRVKVWRLTLTACRAGAWCVKHINHPFTVKAAGPGSAGAHLITPFRNLIREQLLNGKPRNS